MSTSSAKSVGKNIQESKFIDLKKMNTNETNNNGFQAIYKVISDLHALETQNIESSTTDSDLNKEIDTTEIMKVSNGAKIRNRYNQVPHLTQDTNGKVTNSQKTPQTRAKRSALSQQVTTKHI